MSEAVTMTNWCWFVEELGEVRYTANCAEWHEGRGHTVTVIQAGGEQ